MMQLTQLQDSTVQHPIVHSALLCAVPCYQDPVLHYAARPGIALFAFLLLACVAVGCTRTCKHVLAESEVFTSINMQVYNCSDLDDVFEPVALAVRKASKGLYGYGAVAAEAALLKTTARHTIKQSRLIAALVPA